MTAFPNIQQFFKKIFSTVNLWVSAVSTRLSLRKSWQNGRHKIPYFHQFLGVEILWKGKVSTEFWANRYFPIKFPDQKIRQK